VFVATTIALPVDMKPTVNSLITTLTGASGCAGVTGLLAGRLGLTLSIVEHRGANRTTKAATSA
jgi:hypothetical protein